MIARESFDVDTVQANYRKVALWSAEQARSDYIAGQQVSNPQSPLAPLSAHHRGRDPGEERLAARAATSRWSASRPAARRRRPGRSRRSAWVAVIRYRYSGEPMRLEDRLVNPLGFQVLRYRRDAEALPPRAARRGRSPQPAVDPPVAGRRRRRPAGAQRAAAAAARREARRSSCEAGPRLARRRSPLRPAALAAQVRAAAGQRRSAHPERRL